MKMLWDDSHLYVCAIVESTSEVVSSFTERNSPIFQKDSDFEVFIDAAGTHHSYKELEVNPSNVVWNLLLTRPYADGGGEHSGRVAAPGAPDFYEVAAQRTATRLLKGRLGAPSGATWAVEIAMAHSDTLVCQPSARPPAVGHRWRINFSRVEECGAVNWTYARVHASSQTPSRPPGLLAHESQPPMFARRIAVRRWGPQVVWQPRTGRYEGQVNMHLPLSLIHI